MHHVSYRHIMGIFIIIGLFIAGYILSQKKTDLPVIAIANYGPHSSLNAAIEGFKAELSNQGFTEEKTITYRTIDVGFNTSQIPQMLEQLRSENPRVIMLMGTPIAQYAKNTIHDIPLIYNVITDPVDAGLITAETQSDSNITGSSDRQNLKLVLQFMRKMNPNIRSVGLLYSTAEINDHTLLTMMNEAAKAENISVHAISIDQARDIPMRMQKFHNQVDFIYVGTSGMIQPALPIIAAEAQKMHIPIINVDEGAVKSGLALASYGVNYHQIGANAGKLAAQILNGIAIQDLTPLYPGAADHQIYLNKSIADKLNLNIPHEYKNIHIVE